jgi:hypothetical protein
MNNTVANQPAVRLRLREALLFWFERNFGIKIVDSVLPVVPAWRKHPLRDGRFPRLLVMGPAPGMFRSKKVMPSEARYEALKLNLDTNETPMLGPSARPETLSPEVLNAQLDEQLTATNISGQPAQLIRSLVLLWHDHVDLSHEISQSIDDADGSYLHGIVHRREPDFGNAAYWFRRVGDHPIYPELANEVSALSCETAFTVPLTRGGKWNPLTMIDACEAVDVGSADEGDVALLREVQSIEFHLLLKRFCQL